MTKTATKTDTIAVRSIREQHLLAIFEIKQQRLELDRESRKLAKAEKELSESLLASLQAEGRTEIRRGDFVAKLAEGRATVAWKQHFIDVAGQDAADELVELAVRPTVVKVDCKPTPRS